jgi:hypothetical protein
MGKLVLSFAILVLGGVISPLATMAHPLPGSTLTLVPEVGRVELTLSIPVPELILAQPALAGLAALPNKTRVPTALQLNLNAYLQEHIALTTEGHPASELQVTSASINDAQDEGVDHYDLLTVRMVAPTVTTQKLSLTYDAVLHEVRNHRVDVWLAPKGKAAVLVGKIRYDAAVGRAKPLLLPNIP